MTRILFLLQEIHLNNVILARYRIERYPFPLGWNTYIKKIATSYFRSWYTPFWTHFHILRVIPYHPQFTFFRYAVDMHHDKGAFRHPWKESSGDFADDLHDERKNGIAMSDCKRFNRNFHTSLIILLENGSSS